MENNDGEHAEQAGRLHLVNCPRGENTHVPALRPAEVRELLQ